MAFATVADIEARWRTLDATEQARATALLSDASAMLTRLVEIDPEDSNQAALLAAVSAQMVIRAMSADPSMIGATQAVMTAGPYQQTASFASPAGDMYLTKAEKRMLGITSGYIRSIRPRIGGCDD